MTITAAAPADKGRLRAPDRPCRATAGPWPRAEPGCRTTGERGRVNALSEPAWEPDEAFPALAAAYSRSAPGRGRSGDALSTSASTAAWLCSTSLVAVSSVTVPHAASSRSRSSARARSGSHSSRS